MESNLTIRDYVKIKDPGDEIHDPANNTGIYNSSDQYVIQSDNSNPNSNSDAAYYQYDIGGASSTHRLYYNFKSISFSTRAELETSDEINKHRLQVVDGAIGSGYSVPASIYNQRHLRLSSGNTGASSILATTTLDGDTYIKPGLSKDNNGATTITWSIVLPDGIYFAENSKPSTLTSRTYYIGYEEGGAFQTVKSYTSLAGMEEGLKNGDIDPSVRSYQIRYLDSLNEGGDFTLQILSSPITIAKQPGITIPKPTIEILPVRSVGRGADYLMGKVIRGNQDIAIGQSTTTNDITCMYMLVTKAAYI